MVAISSDACYQILSVLMYNNVLFTHAMHFRNKILFKIKTERFIIQKYVYLWKKTEWLKNYLHTKRSL